MDLTNFIRIYKYNNFYVLYIILAHTTYNEDILLVLNFIKSPGINMDGLMVVRLTTTLNVNKRE